MGKCLMSYFLHTQREKMYRSFLHVSEVQVNFDFSKRAKSQLSLLADKFWDQPSGPLSDRRPLNKFYLRPL